MDSDQFSAEETERRLEKTLEGAFSGPPTLLKDIPNSTGQTTRETQASRTAPPPGGSAFSCRRKLRLRRPARSLAEMLTCTILSGTETFERGWLWKIETNNLQHLKRGKYNLSEAFSAYR